MRKILLMLALISSVGGAIVALEARSMPQETSRTPVLLELFTSESCLSCPPADRLLESLDQKQPFPNADLIVLSEHVDYWNDGGWVDPYSSRAFTTRQQSYERLLHVESVYTPQLVIDGSHEAIGSDIRQVRAGIEAVAADKKIEVTLANLVRNGNEIHLNVRSGPVPNGAGQATLFVALAQESARSNVAKGENAGRALSHVAVVRVLMPVGSVASGQHISKDVSLTVPAAVTSAKLRVVTFLQTEKSLRIVGAAQSKL